jgi:TRAF3-interacting protein 1
MVRPGTGKKPDRVLENTKEVTEEKTSTKPVTGIISEKGNKNEEKVLQKAKIEDDDLGSGPNKSNSLLKLDNAGSMRIEAKLGKFSHNVAIDGEKNEKAASFNIADLQSIKNYVQEISMNANPIGKVIDFLQDDIESMNKEMQSWIKEAKTYKDRYDEEVK